MREFDSRAAQRAERQVRDELKREGSQHPGVVDLVQGIIKRDPKISSDDVRAAVWSLVASGEVALRDDGTLQ
jgi:hypothetical protein